MIPKKCRLFHKWNYSNYWTITRAKSSGDYLYDEYSKEPMECKCTKCGLKMKRYPIKEQDGHSCGVTDWEVI